MQFVEVDQLLQPFAQRCLALKQLLLIGRADQEELAGRLIPGDARYGLRFVGQMLRRADPLADVVFALQLHQAADAEGDQQGQQRGRANATEQRLTQMNQAFGQAQRPLRRAQLDIFQQRRQQADRRQIRTEQAGSGEHGDLRQCRERRPRQRQIADDAGDQAQGQPRQRQAQGRPAVPGLEAPALG